MQAHPGDILTVDSNTVGRAARHGTILDVRAHGEPPYWVRWDDGHEALTYPGPDAHVAANSTTGR